MGSYDADDLRALCDTVPEGPLRDEQRGAVEEWIANAPKNSRHVPCPGCGEKQFNRAGRLCSGCMRTLVQHTAFLARTDAATAAPEDADDVIRIEQQAHWNSYPWLNVDVRVEPDSPFYRGTGAPYAESATSCFDLLLHEFLTACLQGFPPAQNHSRATYLFGTQRHSTSTPAVQAPKGFAKTCRTLGYFVPWVVAQARAEGFEEGTDMLRQLATGSTTADQFSEAVADRIKDTRRHLEKMTKKASSG